MTRYRDYANERKATWKGLSRPQLRLVMAGLADREAKAKRLAVRARLRRRRLEAVAIYRALHGSLREDRLWVAAKLRTPRLPTLFRFKPKWQSRRHG